MQKFFKTALALAAFAAAGASQAAVIDFENLAESPNAPFLPFFTTHLDEFYQAGYSLLGYSTKASSMPGDDLVGFLGDGAHIADTCSDQVKCPTNNLTNFYGTLNDGGLAVYLPDSKEFKMSSLDASFIATPSTIVPGNALVLIAFGYDKNGNNVYSQRFDLPGPVNGAYSFSTYTFDAANADILVNEVDIQGYSCAVGTVNCVRNADKAQFALDNINVTTISAVPEPSEWLLMGLGLAVVGGVVRRRRAAQV